MLQFGTWVAEEVLAPVPHRQYVFTVPKMLRVYFRKDRRAAPKSKFLSFGAVHPSLLPRCGHELSSAAVRGDAARPVTVASATRDW